ncbi:MAG: hypothetical protein ACETWM_08925 [Candidatus Lokiarchaeia archaeon]
MKKQERIEKAERFIENLKDLESLERSHKKFLEEEPRDFIYKLVSKKVKEDMPPEEISDYLQLFLQVWNMAMYQRLPKSIKRQMHSQILEAYKNNIEKIQRFPEKIEEINLNKNGDLMIQLFNNFAAYESIKYTGASKLLHLLKPNLFPIWDQYIKNFYHRLHSKEEEKKLGGECYFNFMGQTKEITLSFSEEEKSKLSYMCGKNTIIRIIDEHNYVNITLPIQKEKEQERKLKEQKNSE